MALDWHKMQQKWQQRWAAAELGKAAPDKKKEKFMMIFAYPGISGYLHVGHLRGFSYTDAICRYERLRGKEVLFPVGTHASGNQALAFAAKVKAGDPDWLNYLRANGCPEEKILELSDSRKVVEYFNQVYVSEYWKKFGFLCDWERFTCTINPDYEKFIQWQFRKLQQKNLLVQKPYFATACVQCGPVAVDPSETDISKGGHAEKQEFTLLKFRVGNLEGGESGKDFLVAATLRPETIFGQTNLWVNPESRHVRVEVEGENWILTEQAAEKLAYQKDDVLLKEDVDIRKYIGRTALAPGIEREIIILPSSLCDPAVGTGIVTSVPSDAPYDYLALRQLQEAPAECQKYGLDPEEVGALPLIPIIKTQGYGDFPAEEIVEAMKITSLNDPRMEEATREIYKAGFHTGVMRENCGKYSGMRVEEAKELVKADLIEKSQADVLHDLSEEVLCRCGNRVVIKRIDDQWFIRYSDPELTERSKEQAREMRIYPAEYYGNMPKVLDWFSDRACARLGNWLGSRLPFDEKWTVEPISDSTLYPAYYLVSKFVNSGQLAVEELTEEFFDYVFLGKSPVNPPRAKAQGKVAEKVTENNTARTGEKPGERPAGSNGSGSLPSAVWKAVREEFNYFYPLDLNLGGKEHQTVHFPVFLMNHVGILPEEKWPQGIFVNWWVIGKGSKISKSKGGAEPIPDAIQKYGVDAMRLYYAHIGSPHVDVTWEEEAVLNYKQALERIHSLAESLLKGRADAGRGDALGGSNGSDGKDDKNQGKYGSRRLIDAWLLSKLNRHLKEVSEKMQQYQLRELASVTYFGIYEDIRWYLRRDGQHKETMTAVLDAWCRLMNPLTPHLSEEIAEMSRHAKDAKKDTKSPGRRAKYRKTDLISASSWPEADGSAVNLPAEAGEELVRDSLESLRTVLRLSRLEKPAKCTIFIAEHWLYELFTVLSGELKVTRNIGEIMKKVLEAEEMKMRGKDISRIVASVVRDVSKLPALVTSQDNEYAAISDAGEFFRREIGCLVEIIRAEDSEHPKARSAMPGKVGIVVE